MRVHTKLLIVSYFLLLSIVIHSSSKSFILLKRSPDVGFNNLAQRIQPDVRCKERRVGVG